MKMDRKTAAEVPVLLFKTKEAWGAWLEKNQGVSSGVWLRLAKKGSAIQSLSYSEALEVALCYGWIDGQKRGESENAWLQKFTPRTKRSIWSKVNRQKALALIKTKQMRPAGMKEIARAKKDGRWAAAYDSSSSASVPADLQAALDKNPRAKAFFDSLDRGNRYAILFRIQTAKKTDTRAKKIEQFIRMLERNEKVHP